MSISGTRSRPVHARALRLALLLSLVAGLASATTVVPTTDASLFERADVVVHGRVLSSTVIQDLDGSPVTVTEVEPIEVFKGGLPGNLILRQAGGTLSDGTFFKLWGRPEYVPGREAIVFAIARPEGDFQTAEMLLGKFDIARDALGRRFAVAPLSEGEPEGVTVRTDLRGRTVRSRAAKQLDSLDAPRELADFSDYLRNGARGLQRNAFTPRGVLVPVEQPSGRRIEPQWVNLNNALWRFNNNATAAWVTDGAANMSGGGSAETQRSLATWTNDSLSTINYTMGGSNPIHLSALSSPCGWSTALPPELGVIGCGGPRGGGTHTWRNETYSTITGGEVWLRAFSIYNQISSLMTESILTHELGHTLGLGHSDQGTPSSHDVCKGDEGAAMMRSMAQSRTTLGSDDQDAVRWLYGDGGNFCSSPPPCTAPTIGGQPQSTTITSGQSATLSVSASGAGSYQWYIGASGSTASPVTGGTGSSIAVSPPATTSYWVRVTNSCGSVNSAAATVTVSAACSAPSITSQPQSRSITSGATTTLSVSASGATAFQWYTGGSGNTASPIAGATSASLTVSPTTTTSYWARVSNSCGAVNSAAATVSVSPPVCSAPAILAQPRSVSVRSGETATLAVSASGATSYQWYIGSSGNNLSPIYGATGSSLMVAPGTSTSYWVRVANSCGAVNSATATVSIKHRKRPA